jgi:hypothetical protein
MSATGRNLEGRERRADDFYATPAWCTRMILPHLTRGPTLDPFCGEGAILDVVSDVWDVGTYGIEIDEQRADRASNRHAVALQDALGEERWPPGKTIVTNPPYSLAESCIRRALAESDGKRDMAWLLRLNFLGSQRRADFHAQYPCDVYVLSRRPSFTDGGTDATEYCWMVWGPGRGNRYWLLRQTSAAERTIAIEGT